MESVSTDSIIYNELLTLEGIPPETFGYRPRNRSALDWVIEQYQVSTDKRSSITNDPNHPGPVAESGVAPDSGASEIRSDKRSDQ